MDGLRNNDGSTVYFATVLDNEDKTGGKRIKAAVYPADKRRKLSEIPYASPLLPKLIHIIPKIGEMVMIICEDGSNPNSQRLYVGPVLSQPQNFFYEGSLSAASLLKGGIKKPDTPPDNNGLTHGAFPKKDEIAIVGRKNSDIILSDNDVRVRCGAKLVDEQKTNKVEFNRNSPSFIKLKYYPNSISDNVKSTATIVADKINLISPAGTPYFNVTDTGESISDSEMEKIINKAHQLPYGDELVEFLSLLLRMFKSHTHKYHNMPPCPDGNSSVFDAKYDGNVEKLKTKLLSDNVRIN